MRFSIIGAGRVGVALAVLLGRSGWQITGAAARSASSQELAKQYLDCPVFTRPEEAIGEAQLVFLTVQDREIGRVCQEIVAAGVIGPNNIVLHTSGSQGRSPIQPATQVGAAIGCVHPIQTFPDIESAIKHLPGSWFGVTADDDAMPVILNIIAALQGQPIIVPEHLRPIYHAAAVAACNFVVGCMALASELLRPVVPGQAEAFKVLQPLVTASLENTSRAGALESLTGPVVRNDIATIKRHLLAIDEHLSENELNFYKAASRYLVFLAKERGSLADDEVLALLETLKEA